MDGMPHLHRLVPSTARRHPPSTRLLFPVAGELPDGGFARLPALSSSHVSYSWVWTPVNAYARSVLRSLGALGLIVLLLWLPCGCDVGGPGRRRFAACL